MEYWLVYSILSKEARSRALPHGTIRPRFADKSEMHLFDRRIGWPKSNILSGTNAQELIYSTTMFTSETSKRWTHDRRLLYYGFVWGVLVNLLAQLLYFFGNLVAYLLCSVNCNDILERFFECVPKRLIFGLVVGRCIGILVGLFGLSKEARTWALYTGTTTKQTTFSGACWFVWRRQCVCRF